MNTLTIDLNQEHLKKIEKELLAMPKEAPNALKKAVNATARRAGKRLVSRARRRYDTEISDMKRSIGDEGIKLKIATTASLGATIEVKGQMKEIADFKAEPFVVPKGNKDRVANLTAKVLKASGKKELKEDPKPFVAEFKNPKGSSHVAVVRRVLGADGKSIKMDSNDKKDFVTKVLSPALPIMIGNKDVYEATEPEIMEYLEQEILKGLIDAKAAAEKKRAKVAAKGGAK